MAKTFIEFVVNSLNPVRNKCVSNGKERVFRSKAFSVFLSRIFVSSELWKIKRGRREIQGKNANYVRYAIVHRRFYLLLFFVHWAAGRMVGISAPECRQSKLDLPRSHSLWYCTVCVCVRLCIQTYSRLCQVYL